MEPVLIQFVETDFFSARITKLGLENSLRALQLELIENPERGKTDAGTGGLRKIRIPDPTRGKGKRGGARVHYLWVPNASRVYLIFLYGKDDQESLTAAQKKVLKGVVDRIMKDVDSELASHNR